MSQSNLANFKSRSFYKYFITKDKCWVHHFEAETKQQSMQRKHKNSPAPKGEGGSLGREGDGFQVPGCKGLLMID